MVERYIYCGREVYLNIECSAALFYVIRRSYPSSGALQGRLLFS